MISNVCRLTYFEQFVDPVAERLLTGSERVDLIRLSYGAQEADNWAMLARSHGYQISTRGDLREPWFAAPDLLDRCPDMLAVSSTGAGYDVIDVEACTARGIVVCNQAGSNREAVAEHTLGFMLALSKKIAVADKLLRRPDGVDRYGQIGADIAGKTIGLVGLGYVGSRVAAVCRALGMNVLAHDPYLDASTIAARGATQTELDDLLARSDFVSLHCPRTDETFGMFGIDLFRRMKPSAFFISTARGGIHNEQDLAEAVRSGMIAGAGVDVFLKEPPAHDHPLLALDNVVATPHIAGMTGEALHEMAASAARQWITLFSGSVPPHVVNPQVWPLYQDRFQDRLGFRPADISPPP